MRIFLAFVFLSMASTGFAASVEANKEMVRKFLMLVGSPESKAIVEAGTLPGVIADDIHGRVHPVGTFSGQEGTIEYFLGLGGGGGNPDTVVDSVKIPTLIGENDLVYARFEVAWKTVSTNVVDKRIAFDARFKMNPEGLIWSYDLNAISLGKALDSSVNKHPLLVKAGICAQIQQVCKGDNAVYKNYLDCLGFMNSIPFGSFYETGSNSVICRSVHIGLAAYRPEIHCPHVSKDGGLKCVDVPHSDYFEFSLDDKPADDHAAHGGH